MKIIHVRTINEIPRSYTGKLIYPSGHQEWLMEGELHREDGPAVMRTNGKNNFYYQGTEYSPEDHLDLMLSLAETEDDKLKILFNIDNWR